MQWYKSFSLDSLYSPLRDPSRAPWARSHGPGAWGPRALRTYKEGPIYPFCWVTYNFFDVICYFWESVSVSKVCLMQWLYQCLSRVYFDISRGIFYIFRGICYKIPYIIPYTNSQKHVFCKNVAHMRVPELTTPRIWSKSQPGPFGTSFGGLKC